MGLPRRSAWWLLLAAGLTQQANAQAIAEQCGSFNLAVYIASLTILPSYEDEGKAFEACENARTGRPLYHRSASNRVQEYVGQGTCTHIAAEPNVIRWTIDRGTKTMFPAPNCGVTTPFVTATDLAARFPFSASCATRPFTSFAWTGAQYDGVCSQGCEYDFQLPSCSWTGPDGSRVYSCTSTAIPSGNVCTGTDFRGSSPPPPDPGKPPPPPPPDPEDPPPPDPEDPPPPDPEDPPPPDPEDPPPPDPEDPPPPPPPGGGGTEVNLAGVESRLDAIAQAISSADQAARTDAQQTRGAINGARDAIVSAINGVRSEIDGIGDSVDGVREAVEDLGDDLATWDGPADDAQSPDPWGEATPIDISALDQSGFGWSRSCPQLPSVSFMGRTIGTDPDGRLCSILSLLSQLILLAGIVHAGYIVASRGRA